MKLFKKLLLVALIISCTCSAFSLQVEAAGKPGKTKIKAVQRPANEEGAIVITWAKKKCTGYEIKVATNSKLNKNVKTKKVTYKAGTSATFTGLQKNVKYYVAIRCYNKSGKKLKYGSWSSKKKITTHAHNYVQSKTTAPSCTTNGKKIYQCSCGHTRTETIAKKPHTYELKQTVDSTCAKEGYRLYKCSVCGEEKKEVIEKKEHTWSLSSQTSGTCSKNATKTYKCTKCSALKTEEVPDSKVPTSHHYVYDSSIASTCTKQGCDLYKCTDCGKTEERNLKPLASHTYKTVEKAASCTSAGYKKVMCSQCGTIQSQTTYSALGHDYEVLGETEGTDCLHKGTITKKCKRCGRIIVEEKDEVGFHHLTTKPNNYDDELLNNNRIIQYCDVCRTTFYSDKRDKEYHINYRGKDYTIVGHYEEGLEDATWEKFNEYFKSTHNGRSLKKASDYYNPTNNYSNYYLNHTESDKICNDFSDLRALEIVVNGISHETNTDYGFNIQNYGLLSENIAKISYYNSKAESSTNLLNLILNSPGHKTALNCIQNYAMYISIFAVKNSDGTYSYYFVQTFVQIYNLT